MKIRIPAIAIAMGIFLAAGLASAADIAIIESQSVNDLFSQDERWQTVATNMGHNATIEEQSFLDDPFNILDVDLLIISSGTINIPQSRRQMVREYMKSGVPVYLQCEYDPSFASNQLFEALVTSTGTNFMWTQQRFTSLTPMQISGDLATALNTVYTLDTFLYGCTAIGGFNVVGNMEFDGEDFGWFYDPPNDAFGFLASNTDRNWIINNSSPELMENYITVLLNDTVSHPQIFVTPAGPTTFPAGGGTLNVTVQIINSTNSLLNFDAWTRVILPDGSYFGPLFYQTEKTFQIGYVSPQLPVSQNIPFNAPAGVYTYEVVIGNFDLNVVHAVDGIQFEKLPAAADGEIIGNWNSDGFQTNNSATLAADDVSDVALPSSFTLGDPYPNPFNPSTTVNISLATSASLQLTVYDLQGRIVSTIANGTFSAGNHNFSFDANGLASGVYFLQASADGNVQTRKLVLMQ
jgi:Secretion system C-terminal sorting domain